MTSQWYVEYTWKSGNKETTLPSTFSVAKNSFNMLKKMSSIKNLRLFRIERELFLVKKWNTPNAK